MCALLLQIVNTYLLLISHDKVRLLKQWNNVVHSKVEYTAVWGYLYICVLSIDLDCTPSCQIMIIWWKMNIYFWIPLRIFQFCLLSFSPASLHCNLKMSRLTLFTFTLALISCVNGNGDWRPFHFTMLGVPLFLPTSQCYRMVNWRGH